MRKAQPTTAVRIWTAVYRKLKIIGAKKGMTVSEVIESLLK